MLKRTILAEAQEVGDGPKEILELTCEQDGCVFQGSQFISGKAFRKHQPRCPVLFFNKPLEIIRGSTTNAKNTSDDADFFTTKTHLEHAMSKEFRSSNRLASKLAASGVQYHNAKASMERSGDLNVQQADPPTESTDSTEVDSPDHDGVGKRLCFAIALVAKPSRTPSNLTYISWSPMCLWFSIAPMRDVCILVKPSNVPSHMSYVPTELSTFTSVMYETANILV